MDRHKVLVAGAGGALGLEIVRVLRAKGAKITATYRTRRPSIEAELSSLGAEVAPLDLADTEQTKFLLKDVNAAIFTPILSAAGKAADLLHDNQRAVFFSSNNVAIDPGADVYARLLEAEARVRAAAPNAIILRPTMIYGYPGDGNLGRLMKMMRRFPFAPLPGAGKALQQPVYYKALARAAVGALLGPPDHPRTCAVAGPEPLSQYALFHAVARAAAARPLIFPLPIAALAPIFKLVELTGLRLPLTSAQITRAGLDKTPKAEHIILTDIGLEAGLGALAAALDASTLDDLPEGA